MFDALLLKPLLFYYDGKLILKLISSEKLFNAYKYFILDGIYPIKWSQYIQVFVQRAKKTHESYGKSHVINVPK